MFFRRFKLLLNFFFCWAVLCADTMAQAGDEQETWKQLSAKLTQQKGLWVLPGENSAVTAASYQFRSNSTGDSLLLKIDRNKNSNQAANYIREMIFAWNESSRNVQVWGKDVLGNIYRGESGRITASEISFDLLDPTITSTPSFLRFNQSVMGNRSSISFYKQDADKWVFIRQENLTVKGK